MSDKKILNLTSRDDSKSHKPYFPAGIRVDREKPNGKNEDKEKLYPDVAGRLKDADKFTKF